MRTMEGDPGRPLLGAATGQWVSAMAAALQLQGQGLLCCPFCFTPSACWR